MHRFSVLLVAFVVLTLATAVQAKPEGAVHAAAELIDTSGTVIGDARFVEDATGAVHVNVHVQGLAPGEHGIHIHAVGDCTLGPTPAFAAAAGHFNPSSPPRQHGAHAGDLPNLGFNPAHPETLQRTRVRFVLL
jgi:Cu-Zn family superoxide dismutase